MAEVVVRDVEATFEQRPVGRHILVLPLTDEDCTGKVVCESSDVSNLLA